ncbi:MAG: hypothetical protein V1791_12680 [Pseudomonadota bacterium]
MSFDALEMRERIRKNRRECFYGRRYFYTAANDGHQVIGVLKGLGDSWIVGYVREDSARRALKVKRLWATTHADDLQKRLDEWAKSKGLKEVPSEDGTRD